MGTFFAILLVIGLFLVCCNDGIQKTFRRQPVVAILCVIFLFPVWMIWAVVETFSDDIEPVATDSSKIDRLTKELAELKKAEEDRLEREVAELKKGKKDKN